MFRGSLGRKQGNLKAALSFLAIFGSHITGQLLGYEIEKSSAQKAITEIQSGYEAIIEPARDPQGKLRIIERQLDTTPVASGEFGEMERFMKTLMNKIVSQRNDYLIELDSIKWAKMLDPEELKSDMDLVEHFAKIQTAKRLVAKHRANMLSLVENERNDIATLDVSEDFRRDMLTGFDSSLPESLVQIDALWDLEESIVFEFDKIVTLLSTRKGKWSIQVNQITFAQDSDARTFNAHVASIKTLASKQIALQNQNAETVDALLDGELNKLDAQD